MKSRSPLACQVALLTLSLAPLQAAAIKGHPSPKDEHPGAKGFPHAEFSVAGKGAPWMTSDPKLKKPKKWTLTEDLPADALGNRKLQTPNFPPKSDIAAEKRQQTAQGLIDPTPPPTARVPDGGTTWAMMLGSVFGLGIATRIARFRRCLKNC
jgi:hypothetical protein